MYKQYKLKAIKLRKSGYTYSDINRQLETKISKATFAGWFKNINLTLHEQQILQRNIENKLTKARDKSKSIRRLRKKLYFLTLKEKNNLLLKYINRKTQKIILSILYLGEGSKSKTSQNFSLGNSNPNIIIFFIQLLKMSFKTDETKFRIRIQCRADQNIKKLENFWLKTTGVHRSQMYPTYVDKRTIGRKTKNSEYKGVCVVTYFDRSIQYELEFLAESVLKYIIKGR